MTPTATTPDTSTAAQPSGGLPHVADTHIVRIVVVPPGLVPNNPDPEPGHGLSDDELEAGEAFLTATNAPASWHVPPSKGQPPKMIDVLKPTDIVVIGREPASVRLINASGKPVTAPVPASEPQPRPRVRRHDDSPNETILRVWTESDTIEYQCDQQFEIEKVEKAGWKIFGTPENPFERERSAAPYRATDERTVDTAGNEKIVWKWTSGVLPAAANNQQYKATFIINGKRIDPDVVCGTPPPNP